MHMHMSMRAPPSIISPFDINCHKGELLMTILRRARMHVVVVSTEIIEDRGELRQIIF